MDKIDDNQNNKIEKIEDGEIEIDLDNDIDVDVDKEIKKLKAKLKTCLAEKKDYLDGWQRSKADYLNLNKKMLEDRENSIKVAKINIIKEFLPLADSFEMAFNNKDSWKKLSANWRQGIKMIYNHLKEILDNNGIKEINPINELFDPNFHEATGMEKTQDKEKDQLVSKVIEKGYILDDRVIRPAKVIIFNFNKK